MIRVALIVEGYTEEMFFKLHFRNILEYYAKSKLLHMQDFKLSIINLRGMAKKFFENLTIYCNNFDLVTCCWDLYRNNFDLKECNTKIQTKQKFDDICRNKNKSKKQNFIPFLAIYEIETLLYSNIDKLIEYLKASFKVIYCKKIESLRHVNDVEWDIKEPSNNIIDVATNKNVSWKDLKYKYFNDCIKTYDYKEILDKCGYFKNWIESICNNLL